MNRGLGHIMNASEDLIRIAHLGSKGWEAGKVLWKAGIEFDMDLIKD